MRERVREWAFLPVLLLFFLGMLARYGVGVYNDSEQYITMHIHREPLYPLYLAAFRALFGEGWLVPAMAGQGILMAVGITALSGCLARRFRLALWEELLLTAMQLAPHLVTRQMSVMRIFLENSVMSEALCLPLFSFFLVFLLRMLFEGKTRDAALALLFSWLLSMTRGQMMSAILLWGFVLAFKNICQKEYRKLLIPLLALPLAFGLRSLSIHCYNYAVTGLFMGNTYGKVNTLTNVIYACDKEDGAVFAAGSLERRFFDEFMEKAWERGLNYRFAGETFSERAAYLEECHDTLKFEVLEAGMTAYYFSQDVDYYHLGALSDEVAGRMIVKLLPRCFPQWFYDYLLLCRNGFARSIAVARPIINEIAFLLYALAAALSLRQALRGRRDGAVVMGVALLFIAANVCATSLTIMCLSRYMIYGFSLFYMAFFLLLREAKPAKTLHASRNLL